MSDSLRSELLSKGTLSVEFINSIPLRYNNKTSYNTSRRHLNVLVNYLHENGFDIDKSKLKTRKQEEVLHKPIKHVKTLLDDIYKFNRNLHLCCLMTYCCLLRPHQEIRLLKWSDFNDDLSYLSLSGSRVKSKRNRHVPVPIIVRELLVRDDQNINIFSNKEQPYNKDYFKTLFRRFKRVNPQVDKGVTLYSFRHSGAIEIYKRTGSLSKLQTAMGHSSLNVSLTYLRGLEVAELKEEDMPMV
jgi:integrase